MEHARTWLRALAVWDSLLCLICSTARALRGGGCCPLAGSEPGGVPLAADSAAASSGCGRTTLLALPVRSSLRLDERDSDDVTDDALDLSRAP